MWDTKGVLRRLSKHHSLNIAINATNEQNAFALELNKKILTPHRITAYVFICMIKGSSVHRVDLQELEVKEGDVLFIRPHQIHSIPSGWDKAEYYYKLAFDDICLPFLPNSFYFLTNPLNKPITHFAKRDLSRILYPLRSLLEILNDDTRQRWELLGPYLNLLLSEINYNYFHNSPNSDIPPAEIDLYIRFQRLVEQQFFAQPAVSRLSKELAVSDSKLYTVVKGFSGSSPKEYLIRRMLLEAQRMLIFERVSAKDIAYRLGFKDPDYFHRLFKKSLGTTIGAFLKTARNLSA
jgi:AraC family transcriptional regulator, transcriptional activator of pobA